LPAPPLPLPPAGVLREAMPFNIFGACYV